MLCVFYWDSSSTEDSTFPNLTKSSQELLPKDVEKYFLPVPSIHIAYTSENENKLSNSMLSIMEGSELDRKEKTTGNTKPPIYHDDSPENENLYRFSYMSVTQDLVNDSRSSKSSQVPSLASSPSTTLQLPSLLITSLVPFSGLLSTKSEESSDPFANVDNHPLSSPSFSCSSLDMVNNNCLSKAHTSASSSTLVFDKTGSQTASERGSLSSNEALSRKTKHNIGQDRSMTLIQEYSNDEYGEDPFDNNVEKSDFLRWPNMAPMCGDFSPHKLAPPVHRSPYKVILSVDGGGVRGIMPAVILKNLRKQLGGEFKFDLIAGTSVGALVGTAFSLGKISNFVDNYSSLAKKIFSRNWSRWNPLNWFSNTRGFSGPLYRSDLKKRATEDFIGTNENAFSAESLKSRLFFPFYLQQSGNAVFYRNYDDVHNANVHKYKLLDALMSTTAAPTYFNPHVFIGLDDCRYEGIDGGVFANNPAEIAYNEAQTLFPNSKIVLFSIGTGSHSHIDHGDYCADKGKLFWAKKYSSVANQAMASYTHKSLMGVARAGKLNYFRVNPSLTMDICNGTDDVSEANISILKTYANKTITDSADYNSFVKMMQDMQNMKNHRRRNTILKLENTITQEHLSSEYSPSSREDENE
jgi:predicted acylesterase/phospholipase RssA